MSLVLNGSTQYGTAAVVAPNTVGSFSLWIKDTTGPVDPVTVFVDTDPARHQFNTDSTGIGLFFDGVVGSKNGTWTANAWHHIAVTYTSVANEIKTYIDGVGSTTSGFTTDGTPDGTQMTFGARYSQDSSFWAGKMAEVSVYSTVLSGANVALLAAGRPATGVSAGSLVYYWKLVSTGTATTGGVNMTFGGSPSFSAADNPSISSGAGTSSYSIGGGGGLQPGVSVSQGSVILGGRPISGVTIS